MAKDKEEVEVEVKKKSGGNMMLIIVIVLLVLLLVGGGVFTYFLLSGSDKEATNKEASQAKTTHVKKQLKRSTNYLTIGPMYPMSVFIVNLLSKDGSRYLKTKIDLEMDKAELTEELDKKKPLIRDIIIRILSSKTFDEVSTMKGKDKIKDKIVSKINNVLSDGQVKNIFFTDFVVQ